MMDINYELYKVFYHVATTLNFSEASKQLFISQSAVSQSIKTLERKLDQTLFIRSTKKVQLTPEGEILLRHIEPAMNLIQKGEAQLLDAASTGGQIRIGASDTICRYFLVPYLEKFHKTFPNVHIKVINQTSLRCTELLKNGHRVMFVDSKHFTESEWPIKDARIHKNANCRYSDKRTATEIECELVVNGLLEEVKE